jgi:hypothetical protein
LTVADLKAMPRKTLAVVNPHDKKTEKYEGVALEEILRKAGVPQGDALRGPAMATYVLAEAADGYRVVFSLAELDAGIADSEVIVADAMEIVSAIASSNSFKASTCSPRSANARLLVIAPLNRSCTLIGASQTILRFVLTQVFLTRR